MNNPFLSPNKLKRTIYYSCDFKSSNSDLPEIVNTQMNRILFANIYNILANTNENKYYKFFKYFLISNDYQLIFSQ